MALIFIMKTHSGGGDSVSCVRTPVPDWQVGGRCQQYCCWRCSERIRVEVMLLLDPPSSVCSGLPEGSAEQWSRTESLLSCLPAGGKRVKLGGGTGVSWGGACWRVGVGADCGRMETDFHPFILPHKCENVLFKCCNLSPKTWSLVCSTSD